MECWTRRLIFQDIKPDNFIRVNSHLKWIDYEPDKFSDNLFLNMVTRAFIYGKYSDKSDEFIIKLCRSSINQFNLPELEGLHEFMNRVFAKIIYSESKDHIPIVEQTKCIDINHVSSIHKSGLYRLSYDDSFDAEKAFWELYNNGIYMKRIDFESPSLDKHNYFSQVLYNLNLYILW